MYSEDKPNSYDPLNQSLKKSILWNALEPGDPYDIKKYVWDHSDQWLPNCQEIRKCSWGINYSWSVCYRQPRSRDSPFSSKNIKLSSESVIQIERSLKDLAWPPFIWDSDKIACLKYSSGRSPTHREQ